MRRGFVIFDLIKKTTRECVDLAICFNCFAFGYVGKYCKQETKYYKCTGKHDRRNCNADVLNCTNCLNIGRDHRGHQARAEKCPVFERQKQLQISLINYTTDEESENEGGNVISDRQD